MKHHRNLSGRYS